MLTSVVFFTNIIALIIQTIIPIVRALQVVPSCHPRWENMENPENMEKMENINQMTKNTLFMVKKSLFVTQNALFVNQMTQHTLLYGFYVDGWKNHNIRLRSVQFGPQFSSDLQGVNYS